jgi:hypothetical protein
MMGQKAQDAGLIPQSNTEPELIEALVDAQRDQEIAAAQIEALQQTGEVLAIRETAKGDVNITVAQADAYVRRLYADARVDLATNGIKARRSWRTFFQLTLFLGGCAFFVGAGYSWVNKRETQGTLDDGP